jgi:hypothetical protein
MSTLRQLLQEADPLRYEVPPILETLRARVEPAPVPTTSSGTPIRARRRLLAWLPACAAVVLVLSWASYQGRAPLMTPVAAQVRFEVRLAEDTAAPGLYVATVANGGPLVYLHPEMVVGNDDIAQVWVVDDGSPRFSVGVQFFPGGAERMRQATAGHVGRRVAILIDGTVVMAPVVRSPIGDAAVISGQFSREEATRIARGMERS